jgi:short-subunit dehydrogenase
MTRLNVEAGVELTGAFLPEMLARGAGAILNLGSVAGFQPQPANATYAATKAFVNSFSEAVHTDLSGTGLSCTVVCPGPVATELGAVSGVGHVEARAPEVLIADAVDIARAGIEGMVAGKRTVLPGLAPRALSVGGRLAPRSVLLPIFSRVVGSQLQRASRDTPS